LEPSNIPLERQQAYVAMDLQEWRQMALLTDDMLARSPEDLSTQKLARAREVHHMSELRLNSTQGSTQITRSAVATILAGMRRSTPRQ
jgi:biofilm PGA synthesis protein PgaA